MIVSKAFSGLGNQMFQYAAARSLALQNKTNVWLDVSWFSKDTLRQYSLDSFELNCKVINEFKKPLVTRIAGDALGIQKFQFHYYNDTIWELNEKLMSDKGKYIHLSGYWAWPQYFESNTAAIQKDFRLKIPLETACPKWVAVACQDNSVSLHIRRSDYLSDKNNFELFGLLEMDYYRKAINYICQQMSSPVFLLFSDDLAWVKENFITATGIKNYYLVEDDCFTDHARELILMSYCKHNITANSSFSWWGAWLNQNPNKIVIQPQTWYSDKTALAAYQKGIMDIKESIKL